MAEYDYRVVGKPVPRVDGKVDQHLLHLSLIRADPA